VAMAVGRLEQGGGEESDLLEESKEQRDGSLAI
jgi:hypothetical protein